MPPQRPREHQLEKESRTAFQTRLPSQWDFQDIPQPEYGLDGRVEIFDKADLATGRMFFVQLKATDKPELKDALAVQLEIPTCEYYQSLDLPVLIVRYHAPTGKIYAKWFHKYDPYYGKKAKKKITFRFTVEDEWHEETAAQLASDVEACRQLKSPHLTPPVKFTLTLKEQYLHGILATQIELEIRKAAERLFERERSLFAAELFLLPAQIQRDLLSESEHEYFHNTLKRYIERAAKAGNWRNAATAYYNLGNYFKTKGYKRIAFHHYRKAAKYHSEYLEKTYFCCELAGVLFESKRYSLAAKLYKRALSLGEEGIYRVLYADALMFAGRYREAQQAFYAYLSSSPEFEFDSEWRLKACVLMWIRSILGRDEQKRQTEAAIKLATPDNQLPNAVEY